MTTMYSNETFISGYPSIPEAIWQTFVTVTVVGYGDVSPSTHLGRFVGVLAMFLGIFVVALPTGLFSGQFADDWDESKDQGDLTAEEEALASGPPQGRYSVLPTGVAMRRVSVCAPADESVKEVSRRVDQIVHHATLPDNWCSSRANISKMLVRREILRRRYVQ
mmetsp:Transcript_19006/g.48526  ORF Transcript_19006/g.48526 Transcript_19006/m.48526 type:complete len:164 (-) Transcript_19006:163-654(-)